MQVSCPVCQARYRADESLAGALSGIIRCRRCNSIFTARAELLQGSSPTIHTAVTPLHVLIAHESPAFCTTVQQVLASEPIKVSACHDGRETLAFIRQQLPAVVLLDVALPSLYGFQVCEAVRNDPLTARVRIILLAAIYDKTKYKRTPQSLYGADDYIEKHHIPDSLAAMIYRLAASPWPPTLADEKEQGESPSDRTRKREAEEDAEARNRFRNEEPGSLLSGGGDDQHEAARLLARSIITDIALYREAEVIEGIREDGFQRLLDDELRDGRRLYETRISQDVRAGRDYFGEAIAEFIEQKRRELAG